MAPRNNRVHEYLLRGLGSVDIGGSSG
jgi:hypothetical protein